jgi:hypothetical protein
MRKSRTIARTFGPLVAGAALLVIAAAPALAQTDTGDANAQIVMNGRLDVPAGEVDSTGVLFNGNANVAGTLTGALVVFNGDATISGTVREDVVVFNGAVTLEPGARVGGDVISRERPSVASGAEIGGRIRGISGSWDVSEFGWVGRFAWWLGYTISTLILGLVLLAVAPRIDPSLAERARRRMGASFGFGALLFFLLPVVAVLLIAIIVGIPLGLFLLLALALLYTIGYVAAAHVLGRMFVRTPGSRYGAFLAGWGALRVIALVPVLGGVAWVVASLFGLGALLVAARSRGAAEPVMVRPDMPMPVPPTP